MVETKERMGTVVSGPLLAFEGVNGPTLFRGSQGVTSHSPFRTISGP